MPIRTLADISSPAGAEASASPSVRPAAIAASNKTSSSATPGGPPPPFLCCEIPTLPQSTQAKSMLLRVVREFQPIITRRNYNVRSISELCCCGDGLDHTPGRRRKCNRMANTIWGYNQTTSFGRSRKSKSHTIHIRLRHPTDHARFLVYEDVAGTLAHELAHCEHGPHNAAFYKLMESILDEHASLLASGLGHTSSGSGTMLQQPFEGNGHLLGGTTGTTTGGRRLGGTTGTAKNPSRLLGLQSGKTLGGTTTRRSSPSEAAAAAAEARRRLRLRGDRCCRPCVITIDDDDDDDDQPPLASKRSRRVENRENTAPNPAVCIDLTEEEDSKPLAATDAEEWACRVCTFRNTPMALACSMCATERTSE